MEKFIPYEKLSKKEKRKIDRAKRQTWGELNPVTRKPENSKAYNRNKARNWKREQPIPGLYFSPSRQRTGIFSVAKKTQKCFPYPHDANCGEKIRIAHRMVFSDSSTAMLPFPRSSQPARTARCRRFPIWRRTQRPAPPAGSDQKRSRS